MSLLNFGMLGVKHGWARFWSGWETGRYFSALLQWRSGWDLQALSWTLKQPLGGSKDLPWEAGGPVFFCNYTGFRGTYGNVLTSSIVHIYELNFPRDVLFINNSSLWIGWLSFMEICGLPGVDPLLSNRCVQSVIEILTWIFFVLRCDWPCSNRRVSQHLIYHFQC